MSKKNPAYDRGFINGASASLQATMTDIEFILEGEDLLNAGEMRTDLREKLLESLTNLSTVWYKKGFNRGHKESFCHFEEHNEFPMVISKKMTRELLPNTQAVVKLKSTLSPEYVKKIGDANV